MLKQIIILLLIETIASNCFWTLGQTQPQAVAIINYTPLYNQIDSLSKKIDNAEQEIKILEKDTTAKESRSKIKEQRHIDFEKLNQIRKEQFELEYQQQISYIKREDTKTDSLMNLFAVLQNNFIKISEEKKNCDTIPSPEEKFDQLLRLDSIERSDADQLLNITLELYKIVPNNQPSAEDTTKSILLDREKIETLANQSAKTDTINYKSISELVVAYDKTSLSNSWQLYRSTWIDGTEERIPIPEENIEELPEHNNENIETTKAASYTKSDSTTNLVNNSQELNTETAEQEEQLNQIEFYIQILANRKELNEKELATINSENYKMTTRFEENWYKYQICKSNNYKEVYKIYSTLNKKGSFIVAYSNNEKIDLWQAIVKKRIEKEKPASCTNQLLYVVQLSANRKAITSKDLRKVYQGEDDVRELSEDNWFKYQIVIGDSFEKAKEVWKEIGIDKTFIACYLNNQKITLSQALLYQKNNQEQQK